MPQEASQFLKEHLLTSIKEHLRTVMRRKDFCFQKISKQDGGFINENHVDNFSDFEKFFPDKLLGSILAQIIRDHKSKPFPISQWENNERKMQDTDKFIDTCLKHCFSNLQKNDAFKRCMYIDGFHEEIPLYPESVGKTPPQLMITELSQQEKQYKFDEDNKDFFLNDSHFCTPNSAFACHNEALHCGALNIHSGGDDKFWLLIANKGDNIEKFKKFLNEKFPTVCQDEQCQNVLGHKVAMVTREDLIEAGVEFEWTVQKAGEIMAVYPQTIHTGFNFGFCVNGVRFWVGDNWLPHGKCSKKCKCRQEEDPTPANEKKLFTFYEKRAQENDN